MIGYLLVAFVGFAGFAAATIAPLIWEDYAEDLDAAGVLPSRDRKGVDHVSTGANQ